MTIVRTKKYTALEIVLLAFPEGIDMPSEEGSDAVHFEPQDVFEKYSVVIGGITGVTPDRKIIVEGVEPLEVSVGKVSVSLEVVEPEEE